MDLNIKNKNALVCGSSKGIGKAAAIELSKLGANVTLVSRSAERLSEVIRELDKSEGQHHEFLALDLLHTEELKAHIHTLTITRPIHILVNNSGGPSGGPIIEASPEAFQQAFQSHIIASQVLVQGVLDGMKKEGYGRIINIVSTSIREPLDGLGVSNTIRAAMGNWAKTMANELGSFGITVNNVLPGFTDTGRLREIMKDRAEKWNKTESEVVDLMRQQVPLKRFAEPSEIANAVAFLASPAASYITGTNITVDGGRTKSH